MLPKIFAVTGVVDVNSYRTWPFTCDIVVTILEVEIPEYVNRTWRWLIDTLATVTESSLLYFVSFRNSSQHKINDRVSGLNHFHLFRNGLSNAWRKISFYEKQS